MEWMNISYLLAFGAVFVASLSQILLKQSAEKDHKNFFAKFLNWRVILGYALMMGTTVINVFAYRGVELKVTPMIESTGIIWVTVLAAVFNFSDQCQENYQLTVPQAQGLTLLLDSDSAPYGGSTQQPQDYLPVTNGQVSLTLPPFSGRLYQIQ